MQSDPIGAFWEAQNREQNRWERLREIFEKLRLVLDMPSLCLGGFDDILEQLEQRVGEASFLFPEPDWLRLDTASPEGIELYCANHVGALLDVLGRVVAVLAEERARELADGSCGTVQDGNS